MKMTCYVFGQQVSNCYSVNNATSFLWGLENYVLLVITLLLVTLLLIKAVYIAMEYERGIIFRLGKYYKTRGPGLFLIVPFIDSVEKVGLRVDTYEIKAQEMITKDSISLVLSAVVFFRVKDPKLAIIIVEDYYDAIEQFSLTALRSAIGSSALDDVLSAREKISEEARKMLDEVIEQWGFETQRVEIKQIELPESMKRSMAREAEAIREKRARVTKAEGEEAASQLLINAAIKISEQPIALELRRLQMMQEVGTEHNSTIIVGIPQELLLMLKR